MGNDAKTTHQLERPCTRSGRLDNSVIFVNGRFDIWLTVMACFYEE